MASPVGVDVNTVTSVVAGVLASLQSNQPSQEQGSTGLTRGRVSAQRTESSGVYSSAQAASAQSDSQSSRIQLPSILGRRRRGRSRNASQTKTPKVTTWDRTIVCLPACYPECCRVATGIAIPRKKRSVLAANGLIGKVHLESDWTEEEVFAEIRSVFSVAMGDDHSFPLKVLLPTGSGSKALAIPSLSASFKWTPKEVAGKSGTLIYVLAGKELINEHKIKSQLVGEAGLSDGSDIDDGSKDDTESMPTQSANPTALQTSRTISEGISGPTATSTPQNSSIRNTSTPQSSNCTAIASSYQTYISLLSSSESDDDDVALQRGIEASLDERREENVLEVGSVLKEHFSLFPISNDPDEANHVLIRRNYVWKDAVRALSKYRFDCHKSVQVTFVGEQAVDEGGPRREFFHLALDEMANDNTIFQGPPTSRSFTHNVQALQTRKYFYAGMLVSVSLANGGPGFTCLSEAVYHYFCYGLEMRVTPTAEDIPDTEMQRKLQKIETASSDDEIRGILMEDEFDFIGECGFMKPVMQVTMRDIPTILSNVCKEYLILRSSHEIAQFLEGLNTLGLASLIKVYPSSMKQLFICNTTPISSQDLADLFVPVFSPRGSNIREEEEAVFMNWNDYVHSAGQEQSPDGVVTPAQILTFVTGAARIPPMGFSKHLTIVFIEDKSQLLPTASTCSLVLRLPLALQEYEQFKEKFNYAILNTIGFGQV